MAPQAHSSRVTARILMWAGGVITGAALIALLLDLHPQRQPAFGWAVLLFGCSVLVLAFALSLRPSSTAHGLDSQPKTSPTINRAGGSPSQPRPVSFVAPAGDAPQQEMRKDLLAKSITPEILNIRFVAYRCEVAGDQLKAIYQNATQKELKWYEVSSLIIRQFPFQPPWDGKLLLDIVPVAVAGE